MELVIVRVKFFWVRFGAPQTRISPKKQKLGCSLVGSETRGVVPGRVGPSGGSDPIRDFVFQVVAI